MGLTPLGGIMMCARSGDLDPSVVTYIMKKDNIAPEKMDLMLNKESGLLGMSGVSANVRLHPMPIMPATTVPATPCCWAAIVERTRVLW